MYNQCATVKPTAQQTRGRTADEAFRPVRVSKDGAEISAYDIIRHVFGWNTKAHDKMVRTMARRVRAAGFGLSKRALPGGGKPTVTFAAAHLDTFLDALDTVSFRTDGTLGSAVDAYRRAPAVGHLLRHIAAAASAATTTPTSSSSSPHRRRKDSLTRQSPLGLRTVRREDCVYRAVGRCGAVLVAAMGSASVAHRLRPRGDNGDDRPCERGVDAGSDDDSDGGLQIADDSSEDDTDDVGTGHAAPTMCCRGARDGDGAHDLIDADEDTTDPDGGLTAFVESRVMPLATPAKPLRVWCTGGRAAVRLCAVWPMGDGACWGVSLPRGDSSTVDHVGTMDRADVARMLARFVVVPGVVFVASRQWSSTEGPAVGPEVRGARALCDLALGASAPPAQPDP
ncbi:hypothetical protein [Pandoravirus japonicus]|uniref:Uncharacterized protein n=1 Tax=Pandoravirus japonicus TaxID=2823154 RepID=A0A811BSW2_9VIRU|nr:hypothetical protein [Pandoravirus japonicus]